MAIRLVFLKLELKRALQRLPQMVAGAVVLLFLAGTIALFSSRALYGEQAAGRIQVGVVLPEEDALAKKAISMIGSLDSVKSLCDFQYMDREESLDRLKNGELYAVMALPDGLVQGIMDGSNPPIQIIFPENAGLESRIFQELTDAGAGILSAAQAGIYAGDEMCLLYGLQTEVSRLEQDLNRIFLSYSLPREDYFRHMKASATGDLDTLSFYEISGYVLVLLMCAIPVSSYLLPSKRVMRQKLGMAGVGPVTRTAARTAGLGLLFLIVSVPIAGAAAWKGQLAVFGGAHGQIRDRALFLAVLLLLCLAAAAVVVLLYRIAGSLLGGTLLLFMTATAQHFLSGGFLPLVFLPSSLQRLASVLPSGILMKGAAMGMTAAWDGKVFARLLVLAAAAMGITVLLEVREQ